jgi:hypothetical protein
MKEGKKKRKKVCQFITKVDNQTFLIKTPIFEGYVAWCGVNTNTKKDLCLAKIGLRAQNMMTILSSIVNILGRTYTTIS